MMKIVIWLVRSNQFNNKKVLKCFILFSSNEDFTRHHHSNYSWIFVHLMALHHRNIKSMLKYIKNIPVMQSHEMYKNPRAIKVKKTLAMMLTRKSNKTSWNIAESKMMIWPSSSTRAYCSFGFEFKHSIEHLDLISIESSLILHWLLGFKMKQAKFE